MKLKKRYGATVTSREINWHLYDPRFDLAKNPNELNRHGWVVEIDPFDPQSTPVKRTALGPLQTRKRRPGADQ